MLNIPNFAVLDLASRFADGRLSTQKVLAASDEELYEMLIEVRGIGRVGFLGTISLGCADVVMIVQWTGEHPAFVSTIVNGR